MEKVLTDHWHSYLQGNLISTIILNNKIYAELKKDVRYPY